MKSCLLILLMTGISLGSFAQNQSAAPEIKSATDSVSYAFGINIGSDLKARGLNSLNYQLVIDGMNDVFENKELKMELEKALEKIQALLNKLESKKFEANRAEENQFLAENKNKEGVKETDSGLQYIVLRKAEGSKPLSTDEVTVNYKGTLLNGSQFDSSYDRGEPITFKLGQVIPGWVEGLQLMEVGSKYRFYIPSKLAYGERGGGQAIPPYSTLIFEVELLSIGTP